MIQEIALAAFLGIFFLMFGYPLLISGLVKLRGRSKSVYAGDYTPPITVVIPTIVGGSLISKKIENLLGCDYPKDMLEIIVVDSSKEVTKFPNRVKVLKQERAGKASAVNLGMSIAKNEIVVITDDDTSLQRDALLNIVKPLSDHRIGAVMADVELKGVNPSTKAYVVFNNIFRRELRISESTLDTSPHACGELMAFRKSIVKEIEPHILGEDLYIVFKVRRESYRAIVCPEAKVSEPYTPPLLGQINKWRWMTCATIQNYVKYVKMIFNLDFGLFGMLIAPAFFLRMTIVPLLLIALEIYFILLLASMNIVVLVLIILLTSLLLLKRNILSALLYIPVLQVGVIRGIVDFATGNYSVYRKKHEK